MTEKPHAPVSEKVCHICRLQGCLLLPVQRIKTLLTCSVHTEWRHTGPRGDRDPVVGPGHPHLRHQAPLRGVGVQLIDGGEVADQRVGVDIATC